MTPLVVGTREDVAGFALAGIEGVICATAEEADQAIARASVDRLVFVSHELAVGGESGGRPTACQPPTPLVVVLPSRS